MELSTSVNVKRWISENDYKKYVFDTNINNTYDKSYIVIREYIFQDNNNIDALNKIAYYILKHEKNNNKIDIPFYCWGEDKKPISFYIKNIKWDGYNVNPFKSKDRNSELLKEPIEIIENNTLFKRTNVNIVFLSDFEYNIKYYFEKNINKDEFIKKTKELINKEESLISLYKTNTINTNISSEEYYNICFESKIENVDSIIVIFDKLHTNNKMQLIQLIDDNYKVIYKLFKYHTFENEKELSIIFNLNNVKEFGCVNIYYYGKNAKMSIFRDGRVLIYFKYSIDNGKKWDKVLSDKNDIVLYVKESLNIDLIFNESDINTRINYTIDNTEYSALIKNIGIFTNIFEAIIFKKEKKKNSGFYAYKRTSEFTNSVFDITSYIKSRIIVGMTEDDIIKELVNLGYTKLESIPIVKNEIKMIGDIGFNNLDKNVKIIDGTYIVVKKGVGGFEIDIKNCKSYFELENLKYWLIRIIEKSRIVLKKNPPKKIKEPIKQKTISKSSSSSKSSNDDFEYFDIDNIDTHKSKGGVRDVLKNDNNKNYLINRLRNADKELYNDKNKSRKCQKEHQPVVLSTYEMDILKSKGYDKLFDNVIKHGSSEDNQNFYTCPRLWCPISKIPLDESMSNPKCPVDNEEPMYMNKDMKNINLPRYAYLIKNINIPCCGKKNPELDKKIIKNKKNIDKNIEDIEDIEDKNYIMNKFPLPYQGRYGDIPKELYNILYPDNFLEYTKNCSSPNNINKKECVLRKGLIDIKKITIRYDNIIHTISFLLGKTKKEFISDIVKELDIITYISLDNGNVCKDFIDIKPIIYENNIELYSEFIEYNKKFSKIILDIPNVSDITEKALYKKSRLLYIYKSYKKFITYLSADNYPFDKGIQYLYSLIAIIYKRLIVVWEIEKQTDKVQINMICPYYTRFVDIQPTLDKNAKMIMIVKENNFYEPLVTKAINMKSDKKTFILEDHQLIKKILTECSEKNNFKKYDIGIFNNRENIKVLNKLINDKSELFIFETLIINSDFTIDKIMLKNNMILRFKPQSIVILQMLINEFNIKNVVFHEDIIGNEYYIKTLKEGYLKYKEKIEKINQIGFTLDTGASIFDNEELMKNKLIIKDDDIDKNSNQFIPIAKHDNYHKYVEKDNEEMKKWLNIRTIVKNKLLSNNYTNEYYKELSKSPRKNIIKTLLDDFEVYKNDKKNIKKIQIILEEIPLTSITDIKKWYNNSLLYVKYDYINDLSNNIKEEGDELIFTQYNVSNKIPKKILKYHEALPNGLNELESEIHIDQYKPFDNPTDSENILELPNTLNGNEIVLNTKWTKYKKKIWYKLRYIKCNYTENTIKYLFEFISSKLNIDIISYDEIIEKSNKYYIDIFRNNKEDSKKNIRLRSLFKDPHFYNTYIKEMNKVNKTKKTFKTVRIFNETYFNNSNFKERNTIINNILEKKSLAYPNDIILFNISKLLNISIMIIHNRAEYGKGINVDKRAGDKDLNITTTTYKANSDILRRPLLILFRKIEKTHISYYIVKNIEYSKYFYMELEDSPEEIKKKLLDISKSSNYLSSVSTSSI